MVKESNVAKKKCFNSIVFMFPCAVLMEGYTIQLNYELLSMTNKEFQYFHL